MGDLANIVTGLANRIKAGMPAADTLSSRVFAFAPDSLDPPVAVVVPSPEESISFDDDFSGTATFNLVVKVLVAAQVDRFSAAQLLDYMDTTGTTSIRAAINGDKTLGGACSDLHVTGVSGYGDVEWAGQLFYGADMHVEVLA